MSRARKRINIRVGKTRGGALWPSEPGYIRQMNARCREITGAIQELCEGLVDVSEDIMLEALDPTGQKSLTYCPIEFGPLRESFYLEKATFRGKPRVEMGYAKGGNPPYAMYVHEIREYNHEPPTRAKFLEDAVMEDLELIRGRLVEGYRAVFPNG